VKIVIAGGSGQIGAILCRAFSSTGDEVVVLSRKSTARSSCRSVQWDGKNLCGWRQELEGADVVINRGSKCQLFTRLSAGQTIGELSGMLEAR
jgi:NAD dependent epimerase/dehydratase family enzyme